MKKIKTEPSSGDMSASEKDYLNPDAGCGPHGAKQPSRMCQRNEASRASRARRGAGKGKSTAGQRFAEECQLANDPSVRDFQSFMREIGLLGPEVDPMLATFKPTLDPKAFHDPILAEMAVMGLVEEELKTLKVRIGLPARMDRRAGRVN